ncbi:MAG: acyl-CoA dehydrogenase family protein [Actinomycetota bacterium]|nr:acyl-CoA dehydrogenase family protein [Actinomycetota bacterium]
MDVTTTEEFRSEVIAWVAERYPDALRSAEVDADEAYLGGTTATFPSHAARRWMDEMSERGWVAHTWPAHLGGAGLDPARARVLAEELARAGCRPPLVSVHGLGMIGPALLEFGTPEQQARFVPDIAAGRVRWCQGFSEPGAGSDLAGLSTRAVRDGDEYVVTGQKVWTSFADESDWIFAIVRTDPAAPKRDGLSFLLVDLRSPGIEVRPIALISGRSEFCEVFFDGVRVPVNQRLSDEGQGWAVTRFILGKERQLLGQNTGFGGGRLGARELIGLARRRRGCPAGTLPDAAVRSALAEADIEEECARALVRNAGGRSPGAGPLHPSVVKLTMSAMMQHQADLAVELSGLGGLGWDGDAYGDDELAVARDYLYSKAWTIGGGSSEIQRNLIARQVLELPHLGPEEP